MPSVIWHLNDVDTGTVANALARASATSLVDDNNADTGAREEEADEDISEKGLTWSNYFRLHRIRYP